MTRATPTTGLMPTTEAFAVGGGPQGIGAGPAGQLAYANPGTVPQTVGRISTGGSFQPTKTTGGADPFGVAFGAAGFVMSRPFLRRRARSRRC